MTTLSITLIYLITIISLLTISIIAFFIVHKRYMKTISSFYTMSELDSMLQSYEHTIQNSFYKNKSDINFYKEKIEFIKNLIEYKKKNEKN